MRLTLKKRSKSSLFYVQDERYVTGAWMRRSDDVQDEWYVTGAWMRRSDDVQDERVAFLCSSTTGPASPKCAGVTMLSDALD